MERIGKMNKKILIALGSPRKNGNTACLANLVAEGARSVGAEVEIIDVGRLSNLANGCASCYGCQSGKFRCVLKDETAALINRIPEFDVVVLATPIYFFDVSAQLKRFTDRFMALVGYEEDGRVVSPLSKIQLAVIATSGSDAAESGLETIRCAMRYQSSFIGMPEVKFFHHGMCGMEQPSTLADDPVLKDQALDFGRFLSRS